MGDGRDPRDRGDPEERTHELRHRVCEAFAAVPRAGFLPPEVRPFAHADEALAIAYGSTCSQPSTVRDMLILLAAKPGMRVLDVGSGSGWTTALLAWMTGPNGSVIGVELSADLARHSRATIEHLWPEGGPVSPGSAISIEHVGRGQLGWPSDGPYDRILVSADASRRVPPALLDQLADDGILVAPVDGVMTRVRRRGGHDHITHHGLYAFVPLQE